MIKKKLARAIALTMTGSALSLAAATDASAATTMYNTYNNNGTTPCAPCIGSGNGLGGYTDGWVWGLPTVANGYAGPASPGTDSPTAFQWVGTTSANTTPFGYIGGSSLNWAIQLHNATDSGQISNADAISRYSVSADIDTAKGAWLDNNPNPTAEGWKHDLDIGLFKSDVTTQVRLSASGVNLAGTHFGITVFQGMNTDTQGYVHHGSWNTNQNGTPVPTQFSFTPGDIVATTDTSGAPINLDELVFTAQAGQEYTIFLGGWRDGTWYDTTDGYVLNVAAVPVPAAVWLFGSALAGMGIVGRRKSQTAS